MSKKYFQRAQPVPPFTEARISQRPRFSPFYPTPGRRGSSKNGERSQVRSWKFTHHSYVIAKEGELPPSPFGQLRAMADKRVRSYSLPPVGEVL